jgi:hypothetical protein
MYRYEDTDPLFPRKYMKMTTKALFYDDSDCWLTYQYRSVIELRIAREMDHIQSGYNA